MSYNVTKLDAWRPVMEDKELEIHNKKMAKKLNQTLKFLKFHEQFGNVARDSKNLYKELVNRPKVKKL